jgi:hypothetical protein
MSNQQLSFIGRLDRREEALVMDHLQEKKFIDRLIGQRDPLSVKKLFGQKPVRNVYSPPTRGVDGTSVVMSKN